MAGWNGTFWSHEQKKSASTALFLFKTGQLLVKPLAGLPAGSADGELHRAYNPVHD